VQITITEADRLRGGQAANLIGYVDLTRARLAIENGEENLIDDKKKLH